MTPVANAARAVFVVALLAALQPQALARPNAATAAPNAPSAGNQPDDEGDPKLATPANPNTGPLPPGAVDKRGTEAAPQVEGEDAIVEQPRSFGYTLGDVLTQRVFLAPQFQPEQLPPIERAGLWFARRSANLQTADDGRRWLVMEYQLVNAPQALMTVNIPVVTLKAKSGPALTVAAWPVSVGPLTPQHAFAKGDLQELRPDHPAPKVPTAALRRQLQIWLTAFAATVAAWLTWWAIRSIRAVANQPFAKALREVRQAGDNSPEAWLALHRAFDRTAGRALQTSTLPALFKQAPHFASERTAIEQFYSASNLRFFGAASTHTPAASPVQVSTGVPTAMMVGTPFPQQRAGVNHAVGAVELRELAATLRRIEKQHER